MCVRGTGVRRASVSALMLGCMGVWIETHTIMWGYWLVYILYMFLYLRCECISLFVSVCQSVRRAGDCLMLGYSANPLLCRVDGCIPVR